MLRLILKMIILLPTILSELLQKTICQQKRKVPINISYEIPLNMFENNIFVGITIPWKETNITDFKKLSFYIKKPFPSMHLRKDKDVSSIKTPGNHLFRNPPSLVPIFLF